MKCKNCESENVAYVTGYAHLDFDNEDVMLVENGYLCTDCECFHAEDGSSYEYYIEDASDSKPDYAQIMDKHVDYEQY
jgi:hypothetical protein